MSFRPASLPRNLRTAILAFVVTLGVAALAILNGAAEILARLQQTVDPQVMLLFVPLCALVFAITFEVVRIAARGSVPAEHSAPRPLPRGWQPGEH
jgi:hypothetical protein